MTWSILKKISPFILVTAFFVLYAKPANAQCSGSYNCGMPEPSCEPGSCSASQCDDGSNPHCSWESGGCDDNSVSRSCSGSTPWLCENSAGCGSGWCSGPNNASCSWSGVPLPTPTSTPTPGGGGNGGPTNTPVPPTPLPSQLDCTDLVGYSVNPDVVGRGGSVNIECDFGVIVDCIVPGNDYTSAAFTGWNGTSATFVADVPTTPGIYTNYCKIGYFGTCDVVGPADCFAGVYEVSESPSCTLTPSGTRDVCQGETVNYSVACDVGGDASAVDQSEAYWTPIGSEDWSLINQCAGSTCSGAKTWDETGTFYVAANGFDFDLAMQCSANPWCEWAPNPPNARNCEPFDWYDCTGTDLATVTVDPIGQPDTFWSAAGCPSNDPTINLSWSAVSCGGAASPHLTYEIQRCSGPGCSFIDTFTTAGTNYSDNSIDPNSTYCYAVRACNGSVCGPYTPTYCDSVDIPQVTGLSSYESCENYTIATPNDASVNLSWNDVGCQGQYRIRRCVGWGCTTPDSWIATINGNTNTYTDSVIDNVVYGYRVRAALLGDSGTWRYGPWSTREYQEGVCPDCTIALSPASAEVLVGGPVSFTAFVDPPPVIPGVADDGTVNRVTFTSAIGALSCPSPDTLVPYTSTCTAISSGADTITSSVFMEDVAGNLITDPICWDTSSVSSCLASCSIAFNPANPGVSAGRTIPVEAVVNVVAPGCSGSILPSVDNVLFRRRPGGDRVDNASISDVDEGDPITNDSSSPFITQLTGLTTGRDRLRATATLSNGITCTRARNIEVYNPDWWQAQDADITAGESIRSDLLAGEYLITGDEPGVAQYGTAESLDLGGGTVSTPRNWQVQDDHQLITYNFDYFMNKLPSGFFDTDGVISTNQILENDLLTGGKSHDGYYYYYHAGSSGNVTIRPTEGDDLIEFDGDPNGDGDSSDGRKVILFIDDEPLTANTSLGIKTRIHLLNGGFFMVIVRKGMWVNRTVGGGADEHHIEGIFVLNKSFVSATSWPNIDEQLRVGGECGCQQYLFEKRYGDRKYGTSRNI